MALKPELIEALKRIGFVSATEVQERAIPELLQGKNLIARAKTGTGKTGAFIVSIMQMLNRGRDTEALVIVPTRELALQVAAFSEKLGRSLNIYTSTVYGGASINVQIQELRSGPNIVVGTPGRLIDLMNRGALELGRIRFLVLDEADVMLDMGFIEDIEYIISKLPGHRQMMLFSATMPKEIARIGESYSRGNSAKITVGEEEDLTVNTIKQTYAIVPSRLKFSALLAYIKQYSPKKAIIFARTKFEANAIHRVLISQRYNAILMHGGLTQAKRERSLANFKGGAQFLIATNIAARGLDIADITDIINFGAPDVPSVYVHRIGRSARMGKNGRAMTLADPEQKRELKDIEYYTNVEMTKIELDLEPFRNLKLPISEGRGRFQGEGMGGGFRRHDENRRHGFRRDTNRDGHGNRDRGGFPGSRDGHRRRFGR